MTANMLRQLDPGDAMPGLLTAPGHVYFAPHTDPLRAVAVIGQAKAMGHAVPRVLKPRSRENDGVAVGKIRMVINGCHIKRRVMNGSQVTARITAGHVNSSRKGR
jgi:hypothetical protein